MSEIVVEMGSHNTIIIDKLFGPLSMANLRITIDPKQGEYIIQREKIFPSGEEQGWEIVARINGCIEEDEE